MGLTSDIERFLLDMLELEDARSIEIGRNELADRFSCAPSQINYVLTTRFTPYNGFFVESKRGGSGYIKIIKLEMTEEDLINEILNNTIEEEVTCNKANHIIASLVKEGIIDRQEELLMKHAIDDHALSLVEVADRNKLRASIFKNMLLALLRD